MNWIDNIASRHMTLSELSALIRDNAARASSLELKLSWHLSGRLPTGKICAGEKCIWQKEFKAEYFHYAYFEMLNGINNELIRLQKEKIVAAQKTAKENAVTAFQVRAAQVDRSNYYGDLDYENS